MSCNWLVAERHSEWEQLVELGLVAARLAIQNSLTQWMAVLTELVLAGPLLQAGSRSAVLRLDLRPRS